MSEHLLLKKNGNGGIFDSKWIKDLDNESIILLHRDEKGYLEVERSDGNSFKIGSDKDIRKLFPKRYNWSSNRNDEWESIFKVLNSKQLEQFYLCNKVEIGSDRLDWIVGTSKLVLLEDCSTSKVRYLYNVSGFIKKDFPLYSIDQLREASDAIIKANEIFPLNLTSLASTGRGLFLGVEKDPIKEEFGHIELGLKNQDSIHRLINISRGQRQETRFIGTRPDRIKTDMDKAHLNILRNDIPSLDRTNLMDDTNGTRYFEEAHPGSIYTVRVEVPEKYEDFPPLPYQEGGLTFYPLGKFETTITKPYLDAIIEAGDIKFKIIDSLQFILKNTKHRPYADKCDYIEYIEKTYKEKLYPVNLKALHAHFIGGCLHKHVIRDKYSGEDLYEEVGTAFSPLLVNAVISIMATRIWKLARQTDADAIRVDAVTGKNLLKKKKGYHYGKEGSVTFFNANYKAEPGNTYWRDQIKRCRNKKSIDLERYKTRRLLTDGKRDTGISLYPKLIGIKNKYTIKIKPSGGNRILERKVECLEELLEGYIPTRPPILGKGGIHEKEFNELIEKSKEEYEQYSKLGIFDE